MPDDSDKRPRKLTRRAFISTAGASAAAASIAAGTLSPNPSAAAATTTAEAPGIEGAVPVTLRINGKVQQLRIDPRTTLLDCIRETVTLTGTKKGCDHGQCGACTVHVNGRRVNSCLSLALMHDGDEITTIEGLGTPEKLSPLQAAFVEKDALQCGFCTPGFVVAGTALLAKHPDPTLDEIKAGLAGNLCRCGTYGRIFEAVQAAAKAPRPALLPAKRGG